MSGLGTECHSRYTAFTGDLAQKSSRRRDGFSLVAIARGTRVPVGNHPSTFKS